MESLPSPVPSPDINAPSPSPEEELELPEDDATDTININSTGKKQMFVYVKFRKIFFYFRKFTRSFSYPVYKSWILHTPTD